MINLGKLSNSPTSKDVILNELENGCIECISHCKDKDGYTRIKYNGKHDRLFRVLYQQKYGEISKGLVLRHLCNNSWCCNINHLKVGTQKENVEDMIKVGRGRKGKRNHKVEGEKNHSAKLTEKQVKEIYLSNLSPKQLSEKYKVTKNNIRLIKNKTQWKWLTDTLD